MKDSKTEPASEAKERIEMNADDYGFRVPYDGSNNFYDDSAVKGYLAGATAEYNRAQKEITRLKAELEKKHVELEILKELRNGLLPIAKHFITVVEHYELNVPSEVLFKYRKIIKKSKN